MANTQPIRVLVVDDAQVMRRAVEKMLEAEYDVVLANDGEEGWKRLNSDPRIEMLITDIQMPNLDGYGLICRVRASTHPHVREMPIITITGAEDDETRIRAYACGSTDFIIKPFDRKLLSSRVHAYLRLKQASLAQAATVRRDADKLDALTQLSGLGGFLETGKSWFHQLRQKGQDLSVAALDIDDFPALRRQHGVEADRLLVRIAEILTRTSRRDDIVARVGEAEFAVLIPGSDRSQAMQLCERLRERIAAESLPSASGPVSVSASFGLVNQSADAPETFEKFLVLVELRLSQARSEGGNRVGVSLLSDMMPAPEEVVLTGAPQSEDSPVNAQGEIEIADDAGDLSIVELEAMVRDETKQKSRSQAL